MLRLLSIFCFGICVSICSMEKIDGIKKETKENEKLESTTSAVPESKSYINPFTGEEIPKEWLDYYNIKEDPLGEKEREIYGMNPEDMEYKIPEINYTINESLNETDAILDDNSTNSKDSNSSCRICEIGEEDKRMRIESIKSTILTKIGFSVSNLPNMTGKTIPRAPTFEKLKEQYNMQGDAPYGAPDYSYYPSEDEYYGQIQRAFTISQTLPDNFGLHISGAAFFDIPESVRSRRVQTASLWFYLQKPKVKTKTKAIEIYLYVIHPKAKAHNVKKGPMEYMKTRSYGWQEFKLHRIVHHWVKNPQSNRGVIIQALDENGNNLVVYPGEHADENYIPLLEMATVEHRGKDHRHRRSLPHICSETRRIETCCRYPLRVDFVQFGWDWVIAPTGYKANYCSGECQHRQIDSSPQAYLIQQTAEQGTGPCCTPSKMYPLAMLYFDHNHTVLYTYMHKMIVERCGCA